MKNKIICLFTIVFFLSIFSIDGQNNKYPTKKINGVEYYIYNVEQSEGLFAISRKFNTSVDQIRKANPDIDNGLKIGQQILVPVSKDSSPVATTKPSSEFIAHKVEKKQTLFAISNLYGVSQDDIKKYNPQINDGLKTGETLRIPVASKLKTTVTEPKSQPVAVTKNVAATSKRIIYHIVQPTETLYSISKLYDVDVAELIQLNPGSETVLSVGTTLKIATTKAFEKVEAQEPKTVLDMDKLFNKDVAPKTTTVLKDSKEIKATKVIKIAYILPFMLDQGKNETSNDRFFDFYAGSLIAINEAKKKGISLEIFTYDTEKSENKMVEILSKPELKKMDLIIGPAFSNLVLLIEDFAKTNKVNTLIPFTSKVPAIETNPYLFQFNPGSDVELKYFLELLNGKYRNVNLIFANIPGINSFDNGKLWSESLQGELTKNKKQFQRINLISPEQSNFSTVLKKGQKNLIIFNTDKYSYVSPFLPALNTLSQNADIVFYEQFSWLDQPNKNIPGIYVSPFVRNFNSSAKNEFNSNFIRFFNRGISSQSPHFDLLGYDLTGHFISLINKFGSKFTEKMTYNSQYDWIQSQIHFERISNGSGFINQRLYLGEDNIE